MSELLYLYTAMEKQIPLIDSTQTYADLVTASTNRQYPVQRWFHLKEAYSLDLIETLLNEWSIPLSGIRRILDPFCGTGTSLMAAQRLAKKTGCSDFFAVGMERNPFLHFVSDTKINWHAFDLNRFEMQSAHLLNGVSKSIPTTLPELSTLHREDVFSLEKIKEILSGRTAR